MTRRCSHCNNNGHNTRTCSTRSGRGGGGVRVFGVRLIDGSFIKKSASMGNLFQFPATADSTAEYHSDDPNHRCRGFTRKKGIPWTEEEHRNFLLGLQNLGKGDWRGISNIYVPSRTPSQVASHAQKYFIRQNSVNRKKKRSSLFDMVPNMDANAKPPIPQQSYDTKKFIPSLNLSLQPAITPVPFQLLPQDACALNSDNSKPGSSSHCQRILRPDELAGMSHLNLRDTSDVHIELPVLSLGLPGHQR
ncbi:transcription factor MYBS3-like [Andrographis paniculata]|uniref:transcription factor MYBS3-like n=1 Tax=Andrographis paniculata TaxID=175694 RepID=UPI0021E7D058|nr:transcription factor MYBS3-like [Andrographis paniculata]